ncbi:Putative glutathione transferase 3 [Septoria linicola]|uniref:Glutathione transferase 3 n=1 Tax=Septoria linicola TaxID=215465 RepID=A0A9Q9APR1_9PEZI|nr:Putative glutathione transferase 3 [Septoria linicola]
MSHSWLQRQRKAQLLELSEQAGLKQHEDTRKDDIVENLNDYLQTNSTRLAREPAFSGYFGTRSTPGRPSRASASDLLPDSVDDVVEEVKSVVKSRGRRATQVKQESEDDEGGISSPVQAVIASASNALSPITSALSPSGQLNPRTPALRGGSRRQSQLPGPPSPSAVAELAEEASHNVTTSIKDLYNKSGVDESISNVRETLSSIAGIHVTVLILEGIAVQREVFPWQYAFDIPATPITPAHAVSVPNLFILLTGVYWSTILTWSTVSIFVPLLFAYFYNLTIRDVKRNNMRVAVPRYRADPLTYNIVKALLTYIVFKKGVTFGVIAPETIDRIEHAVLGGSNALLIGSGIGAIGALYEAAQHRVVS